MATDLAAQKARLKEQQEKLARKLDALTQKEKAEERKRDTRRKIIIGGAVLAHMETDIVLANLVRGILARNVGRPIDRAAIADLLPPSPSNGSTPAPANDGGSERGLHEVAAQIVGNAG
jgi:hypothetical protein